MRQNHRPEVTSENASEYSGSLGFVADDGVFRLDAVATDEKS
jgi:hypothetical protein